MPRELATPITYTYTAVPARALGDRLEVLVAVEVEAAAARGAAHHPRDRARRLPAHARVVGCSNWPAAHGVHRVRAPSTTEPSPHATHALYPVSSVK